MLIGRRARPGTGIDLDAFDPAAQRLRMHIDQQTDLPARLDRRLARVRLAALLVHPHRTVAGLLVVLAGCRHGFILLGRSEPLPEPGHLIVNVKACNVVPNLKNVLATYDEWFPYLP